MQVKELTIKQRMFVNEYSQTGNASQAAMVAYNCKNLQSADAVARETLENPRVQSAIHVLMQERGLDNESLLANHQELLKDPDPNVRLKALDMAYKLNGSYKNMHFVINKQVEEQNINITHGLQDPIVSKEEMFHFLKDCVDIEIEVRKTKENLKG